MIDKLRSRGPVDVPADWQRSGNLVGWVFAVGGVLVLLLLAGVVLDGVDVLEGALNVEILLLLVLGGASVVATWIVLTIAAARSDL